MQGVGVRVETQRELKIFRKTDSQLYLFLQANAVVGRKAGQKRSEAHLSFKELTGV